VDVSGSAEKRPTPVRLLRRFGDHMTLRKLLRPQPRHGVVVATCQNDATARVIAGRLADEGIKAFVFQEETGTGLVPVLVSAAVHVIVREEDGLAASALLA